MASVSSQARTTKQSVCGTPRQERWWQAHLPDTRIESRLWHSHQMACASSQARTTKQFVCGTPQRERQQQAHLLDTRIWSHLSRYRQMASTSARARAIGQFVCGTPQRERQWRAHLQDTWSSLSHSLQMANTSSRQDIDRFVCSKLRQKRRKL